MIISRYSIGKFTDRNKTIRPVMSFSFSRLKHYAKSENFEIKKKKLRKQLSKLILFNHQWFEKTCSIFDNLCSYFDMNYLFFLCTWYWLLPVLFYTSMVLYQYFSIPIWILNMNYFKFFVLFKYIFFCYFTFFQYSLFDVFLHQRKLFLSFISLLAIVWFGLKRSFLKTGI